MRNNKKDYSALIIIILLTAMILTFLWVINWAYGGKISKNNVPESIVMSTINVNSLSMHNENNNEQEITQIIPETTTQIKIKKKRK